MMRFLGMPLEIGPNLPPDTPKIPSAGQTARSLNIGVDPGVDGGDQTMTWIWAADENGKFWVEREQCYLTTEQLLHYCRRQGIPIVIDVKAVVVK